MISKCSQTKEENELNGSFYGRSPRKYDNKIRENEENNDVPEIERKNTPQYPDILRRTKNCIIIAMIVINQWEASMGR